MGHASPKTTMDHYAHLLPGVDQNYVDFLDESEADDAQAETREPSHSQIEFQITQE